MATDSTPTVGRLITFSYSEAGMLLAATLTVLSPAMQLELTPVPTCLCAIVVLELHAFMMVAKTTPARDKR